MGSLAKSQSPTPLLNFLNNIKKSQKAENIILKFIGSVHEDIKRKLYDNFIPQNLIFENYLEHELVLEHIFNSDYLLAVVPKTKRNKGIIPGKIFEYLRTGRTILLIGPYDCDAAQIIYQTEAGFQIGYNDSNLMGEIILSHRTKFPQNYSKYDRNNLTRKLVNTLDSVM